MENISHTLAGFVMARAGLERTTRLATVALVVGSNLPDIDAVELARGRLAYIDAHRGLTHSFMGGAVLAIAFGALLWAFDRWALSRLKPGSEKARLLPLMALSWLAVFIHLAFDFLNDYGIRLLLPFSSRWYYGDIIFVVDPWFWLLLGGALHLTMARRRIQEALAWVVWALLSAPVLLDPVVSMPARWVWLLGLTALAAVRLRWGGQWNGRKLDSGYAAAVPDLPRTPHVGMGKTRLRWSRAALWHGALRLRSLRRHGLQSANPPASAGWSRRVPTRAALAILSLYCLGALALHTSALQYARSEVGAAGSGEDVTRLSLLPRPADPFHWNILYERDQKIVSGSIGSWRRQEPEAHLQLYAKNLNRPEVVAALSTPMGRLAHRFCRYLFADLREGPKGTAVAFRDARFAIRGRHEFSVFLVPASTGSEVKAAGTAGEAAACTAGEAAVGTAEAAVGTAEAASSTAEAAASIAEAAAGTAGEAAAGTAGEAPARAAGEAAAETHARRARESRSPGSRAFARLLSAMVHGFCGIR